ncbi:signal transduction histidine kinase [Legionella steigerwaltii]|uniref:histidine kinase n=1 Tax=Legionella steigerwaltii TaxID=460 RepID=A0A378L9X1_9GAMM|nr:MASE1 domain-containing protein [Legionella steigerwaltii]KTD80807.1 signal transduction histidine kinase [Legionella steigerwaltii]STY23507.1 signal transduction histidine kinase [Legionella steigerwaltii]
MSLNTIKTWRFWFQNIITAFLYTLGGLASNIWTAPNTLVTPLWLPSGIALAMVLWYGNYVFLGIVISETIVTAVLGDLLSWQNWAASTIIGLGAGLQAIWASMYIQYYTHTKTPFYTVHDILLFIFGGDFLLSLTSCTLGILALLVFGLITPGIVLNDWFVWWIGDVVGIIVITPLIMTWYQKKLTFNLKRCLEFIALLLLLGCTISLIYMLHYPLAYLLLPFGVWAAVRFSTRFATIVAFLISISVIWLEIEGYKEFYTANLSTSLLFLQAFVAAIFFTTLILSAVITERRKAQNDLQRANVELESRVEQRTQDLNEKNIQLNHALDTLKQAETQLIQAEKMSSLGVLTAGIAHEINNPVNFVSANIGPLKNDIEEIMQLLNKYAEITPDTSIKEKLLEISKYKEEIDLPFTLQETHNLLNGIEEGARRTANIVKDLRTFSRLDEGTLKRINIHESIDSTLTLLNNQFRDRITIKKNYGDLPEIECFSGKINQVFMNILINAAHAIPEQGEITITTSKENDQILIRIRDTGIGMSKETITKIFEPFFTTKPVGKGTGLGLSISYSIVQEHHGTISIKSAPGKGSEFIITLPIKQAP